MANEENSQAEGTRGFSQKILRYFLTFLQTDFKKQQAPRRRIQLKSDVGFRTGIPLRKYRLLYKAAWKFAGTAPDAGLKFKIGRGQYTAPINPTLRDLIRQYIDAIDPETTRFIAEATIKYAVERRSKAAEHPEKFVESIQIHFVEEVNTRMVQPLLAVLDSSFREVAYSAIESIYDIEADLTDVIASQVLESLPTSINTLIISGDANTMKAIFEEFFQTTDILVRIQSFFDDFATSDAFQEIRDLHHCLRSAENQSIYLYFCDIRFGPHTFPLFYVPASLDYDEEDLAFVLEFDPHLFINKQAIDWILQEKRGESTKLPISPVSDRVLYLNGSRSFLDEMEAVFSRFVPSFELAADLDLRKEILQQASSPTLKLSNSAYFAIFDKSDESLLNDYEELLNAFTEEQIEASQLFYNILQGFIFENPFSVTPSVDAEWDALSIPDRLVADTPIPLNEEQRKILSALKNPQCNYISVQGPPGTGKSHTITALAFESILSGQSVLILSDKTEALDVVQDKLESVLSKVRHGDDDFPNPILRLGRTGNTFNRLVSPSAKEKIKTHHQAATRHAEALQCNTAETRENLRSSIEMAVKRLTEIKLSDLDELHQLESEIESIRPGLTIRLQKPATPDQLYNLGILVAAVDPTITSAVLARIAAEPGCKTLENIVPKLTTWKRIGDLSTRIGPLTPLSIFSVLEVKDYQLLLEFLNEYESLRMPIFGWVFSKNKLHVLNMRLGATLPCSDPIDLHKKLSDLKQVAKIIGLVREDLARERLDDQAGFAYRLLRNGEAFQPGVEHLADLTKAFVTTITGGLTEADMLLGSKKFSSLSALFDFIRKACRYTSLWHDATARMESLPKIDYVAVKTRLEQLNTAQMTSEIDRRFLDFVDNKRATVKEIGEVIKGRQKFPENEFHHLSAAFPVIIAGIREYAEYVPLKQQLFDLVIIDEASQVSVAQALPAVLRAKKAIVFGDAKQFSNVKSSQASNTVNSGWLTDIEAYFRANVSNATTKLQRLKHFDVKKSILEFFDLITNYQTMLRKHFRGYQELISFSSKNFYNSQLQAIKIRSKPIQEVICFEVLNPTVNEGAKNVNRVEAEFILKKLQKMIDEDTDTSVGIITPFREQVKLLNEILYRDAYGERFESKFKLKIMTFDTCQGEERDLIIYSMVATQERDALNYVFPVDLDRVADKVEDALKAQRLNVGFSRAKEAFLFVLSKPVDQFRGSIGRVLMHYKTILEDRSRPSESSVDPASPMERKVLDWIFKTPFFQCNEKNVEIIPQFPVGEYLKQLDPFYSHPAYRCDFLVRYDNNQGPINVIVEYDGFEEHFVERHKIHNGNWDRYYRPEDVERQMVIESYGYKFLRLNRFNLGDDPVTTLSERLYELIDVSSRTYEDSQPVAKIKGDAKSISDGSKQRCPKCCEICDIQDFWNPKLKSGNGGYGKSCIRCKQQRKPRVNWGLHE